MLVLKGEQSTRLFTQSSAARRGRPFQAGRPKHIAKAGSIWLFRNKAMNEAVKSTTGNVSQRARPCWRCSVLLPEVAEENVRMIR